MMFFFKSCDAKISHYGIQACWRYSPDTKLRIYTFWAKTVTLTLRICGWVMFMTHFLLWTIIVWSDIKIHINMKKVQPEQHISDGLTDRQTDGLTDVSKHRNPQTVSNGHRFSCSLHISIHTSYDNLMIEKQGSV